MFLFPAVYADGRVCISILHAPGDDPLGYESSAERWSPVQSVEKILLSVISMLAGNAQIMYRSSLAQLDTQLSAKDLLLIKPISCINSTLVNIYQPINIVK